MNRLLLFLNLVLSVFAFHWKPGASKCTPGSECLYAYQVESGVEKTIVRGYCAPNGYCADNGAKCSDDSQCFGWCGPDGICGGEGALCNTQGPSVHTLVYWEYTCASGLECSTTDLELGSCERPKSSSSSRHRHGAIKIQGQMEEENLMFGKGKTSNEPLELPIKRVKKF